MKARPAALAAAFAVLGACGAVGPGTGADDVVAEKGAAAEIATATGDGGQAPVPKATGEERAAALALVALVNAARAESGLTPLVVSKPLAAVSRAYCAEMERTGLVAHESAISGGPGDRAARAGIRFTRLTENLAVAADADAAHEGLMNSPGHRANILDPAVTEIGVGAIFSVVDGLESLIVTQLFAAPQERIDPATAPGELIERLNAARRARHLEPFARHAWLDARAAEALADCGASSLKAGSGAEKAPPFRLLRAVKIEGGTLEQIAESLVGSEQSSSPHLTHVGVAVARAKGDAGAVGGCAVVFYAAKK